MATKLRHFYGPPAEEEKKREPDINAG